MGIHGRTTMSTPNGEAAAAAETNGRKPTNMKMTSTMQPGLNGVKSIKTEQKQEDLQWSPLWAICCMTVFPVALLAVQISCSKGSCSIWEVPPFPTDFSSYISLEAVCVYFGWLAFQFVLFVLPTGSKIEYRTASGESLTYRLNGPMSCLVTYLSLFVSIYYGYSYEIVSRNFMSLHLLSVISSFVLALCLYLKKDNRKKGDHEKSMLMRFANGTESHPKIWSFNLKHFLMRTSLLTWGAICFAIQGAQFHSSKGLDPSNTLVTLIHIYLAAEAACLEEAWLSSVLFRHDKVGFQFVYGCLTAVPVLFTTTLRYTADQNSPMSELAVVSRFFLCVPGYCLYRGSLSDKTLFTSDPRDEDMNGSAVNGAKKGSAIVADGFWAYSRNPNYLGCLILALTWLSPGLDGIYKSACVLVVAVYLINRSFAVDQINRRLYGGMWTVYCQRVQARIVKHIF